MKARLDPSLLVVAAGMAAAFHVGKLPPALPVLREVLGISLVQAGFLISLVQLAGMSLGLAIGLATDGLGLRRTLLAGLCIVSVASAAGGLVREPALLLALRAAEGLGFLLVYTPAPGLVRRLVPAERLSVRLGFWGAAMPSGAALALLVGPAWIAHWGWPSWWWLAAALSTGVAVAVLARVPPDPPAAVAPRTASGWVPRLAVTLRSPGPWLIALGFGVYSGQWLAVIGFLPTVYAQAGLAPGTAGVATAVVAAMNLTGNLASGRLLRRGWAPQQLLRIGFATMAVGGVLAFSPLDRVLPGGPLPAVLAYVAVLCFSAVGGLVPGTLFFLSVRFAPGVDTVSTTVGWMQQWSAFGQFAGPPLVAWVASLSGGWHFSGLVTASCALLGLGLAHGIGRHWRRLAAAA
ncbi:CynX/NimT family MFS transporter [Ramlibacter rhizophilus]|uniref:MFS transporter n=1 Tax=Ramlibacter rhizophilus TaxID=1781167 RepID=A0A4Z0BNU3_9BURK|nr:MFS transporter [Ramlibacter rhizophilus]TFY99608.1 MFS transporter [Ramlibacter rhizophilus]